VITDIARLHRRYKGIDTYILTVVASIGALQPCKVQLQGKQLLLRHAEYLGDELAAAGDLRMLTYADVC
jgi:hypothetical protein